MSVSVCVGCAGHSTRALSLSLYLSLPSRDNIFRVIRVLRAMCAGSEGKQSLGQVQMERVARQLAARLTCIELTTKWVVGYKVRGVARVLSAHKSALRAHKLQQMLTSLAARSLRCGLTLCKKFPVLIRFAIIPF